jgi:hypothetical protein
MIYDPDSPFKGRHYPEPVELIDIYPTVLDLLQVPLDAPGVCHAIKNSWIDRCIPLQGKSLAPIIMGSRWTSSLAPLDSTEDRDAASNSSNYSGNSRVAVLAEDFKDEMPLFSDSFAISQMWRCSTNGKGYNIDKDGKV